MIEKKKEIIYAHGLHASMILNKFNKESVTGTEATLLKQKIIVDYKSMTNATKDINDAKTLYKSFKGWELGIELPIQCSLTTILSCMKVSSTVVNKVFQNWFISGTTSLIIIVGMSFRSIIGVWRFRAWCA